MTALHSRSGGGRPPKRTAVGGEAKPPKKPKKTEGEDDVESQVSAEALAVSQEDRLLFCSFMTIYSIIIWDTFVFKFNEASQDSIDNEE